MISLHSFWDNVNHRFAIWGEDESQIEIDKFNDETQRKKKKKKSVKGKSIENRTDILNHPYALIPKNLFEKIRVILNVESSTQTRNNQIINDANFEERSILLPARNTFPMFPLVSKELRNKISMNFDIEQFYESKSLELKNWKIFTIYFSPSEIISMKLIDAANEFKKKNSSEIILGNSWEFWSEVLKLAIESIIQQNFIPKIQFSENNNSILKIEWGVYITPNFQQKLDILCKLIPPVCRAPQISNFYETQDILLDFINTIIDQFIRDSLQPKTSKKATKKTSKKATKKTSKKATKKTINLTINSDVDFVETLISSLKSPIRTEFNTKKNSRFTRLYESYQFWIEPILRNYTDHTEFRTCFKLEPPEDADNYELMNILNELPTTKSKTKSKILNSWSLDFYLQALSDNSIIVPADKIWSNRSADLKYLKKNFGNPQERLLEDLGRASRIFPILDKALEEAHPQSISIQSNNMQSFLFNVAPILQEEGFGIIIPSGIGKKKDNPELKLKLKVKNPPIIGKNLLSMSKLLEFDWQIAIGDQNVKEQDFESLVNLKIPFIRIQGKWVEINPLEMQRIITTVKNWSKKKKNNLTMAEFVNFSLNNIFEQVLPEIELETNGDLKNLNDLLKGNYKISAISTPNEFKGELRPYQEFGLGWLHTMCIHGLNVCLADDMGLGKTIQVIALFLLSKFPDNLRTIESNNQQNSKKILKHTLKKTSKHTSKKTSKYSSKNTSKKNIEKDEYNTSSLLICPMTLISNWKNELERFSPDLKVFIHHGKNRLTIENLNNEIKNYDIVITSYALAARDKDCLESCQWNYIILDEAQNIKNHSAKQTQAIKQLNGDHKIALTGTPIENRLNELWSIMDFLNPGLLGSNQTFHKLYAVPIEKYKDKNKINHLSACLKPFILRRLKNDKNIIKDLPDKIETKEFCNLTKEQASIYQAIVKDMLGKIEDSDGIQRKGFVLAAIMKLKQICNHPDLYSHKYKSDKTIINIKNQSIFCSNSGKLMRLVEIIDEIIMDKEKVLIFTQFAEMGKLLQDYLRIELNTDVLFLSGETPKSKRDFMIDAFQNDKDNSIFILSLKAGGVGLNLTAANNIIHFDRWWNPAVENQATDRAYRIGQKKNVQVHKLICTGTIEEKIDRMIEEKKDLADNIITTSENWITELNFKQLKDILSLNQEEIENFE